MDAKSLSKVILFSVGIPAMNIGSAFAWKCSLEHEHDQDEMCTETGDRPCGVCKKGFHHGWELCPKTVFEIPSENCKLIPVPLEVKDAVVAALLTGCKYDQTSGKEIEHIGSFSSKEDADEVKRLGRYVRRLKEKYLPKKAKGKREGDGEKDKVLTKKKRCRWQKNLEDQKADRRLLRRVELDEDIESEQSESDQETEKEIRKKREKIISDGESEGEIKWKKFKRRK